MYNAVILAGGKAPWLQKITGTQTRALAPLGGRRIVEYIIDALIKSKRVERIIVATNAEQWAGAVLPQPAELCSVNTVTMPETAAAAAALLPKDQGILFICDDLPLISAAAISDFLHQAESDPGKDLYYPIVAEADCERAFPGVERTYIKLTDGKFTGGNIMLVNPAMFPNCVSKAQDIFSRRKKPWELCGWLGFMFVVKFFLQKLSVCDIEKRASELLNIDGKAIFSVYPEVGMDIDKESDWELIQRYFQK